MVAVGSLEQYKPEWGRGAGSLDAKGFVSLDAPGKLLVGGCRTASSAPKRPHHGWMKNISFLTKSGEIPVIMTVFYCASGFFTTDNLKVF